MQRIAQKEGKGKREKGKGERGKNFEYRTPIKTGQARNVEFRSKKVAYRERGISNIDQGMSNVEVKRQRIAYSGQVELGKSGLKLTYFSGGGEKNVEIIKEICYN